MTPRKNVIIYRFLSLTYNGVSNMIEILQMFLFLFKSKYRRKCCVQWILEFCFVLGALTLMSDVSAKCTETSCGSNGVCKNDTCVCSDGWQGAQCQFCGGKVR